MTVVEALWADVLLALATGTFWVMVAAAFVACLILARSLALSRINSGEDPVRSASSMLIVSGFIVCLPFAGLAYALDSWSPGTLTAGAALLILVPTGLAVILGRPIVEESRS